MRRSPLQALLVTVLAMGLSSAAPVFAEKETPAAGEPGAAAEVDPFANLEIRNVGPVNMSGRVADVEGIPGDPRIVYVGAASGGVWKSVDAGGSFTPIFDDQPLQSIGDLALAPSNPEVIYVGTGEGNVRNSVSFGNGVYKSTDGGSTWTHLGLETTRHITRIVVDPTDPDTVFVAAMGSIFGPSETRGVYRSRDGGASWERVLFVDQDHAAADLDIDPKNPNVLFATMWHFRRQPWTFTSGGDDGGVWRSVDGGTTWNKLTEGLPATLGRVAVKVAPSNPRVVYVLAESNDGILFRSDDRGDTFRKINDNVQLVSRGFYYTDLRVDPTDENRVYAIASRLFRSIDGGKSFDRIARSVHIDFHSLWIDPHDPNRMWVGQDGGVAQTYDGDTWEVLRNLPIGQFYQVFVDDRQPFYRLGGGLQDNGTWYGPSRTREPAGILPDDWRMMSFGDAYWVVPHPTDPDVFISESQAGGILRTNIVTRQQVDISPQPRRNDGGPAGELDYRFNWNAPIVQSPHDPMKVYFAGNVVFLTHDFGDSWSVISPDLTTDDPEKQKTAGGPVWPENTTAEYHTTIISFAESPITEGELWVGTDDGNIQLSRDGGASWSKLTPPAGVPAFAPVSHLEPSRTAAGTAYAAFDAHMLDDLRAHVYRTTDHGASWTRTSDGLPDEGWVWVVREDAVNPDVVYAGTEVGLYASWNRGESWQRLTLDGLPPASVHDIVHQPRHNDLVVGTHGRAIFVLDDATPVQQMSEAEGKPAHLFPVRDALRFPRFFTRYGRGDKVHTAPNPPAGALITYHLADSIEKRGKGKPAAEGEGEGTTGDAEAEAEAGEEGGAEGTEPSAKKEPRFKLEILDGGGEVIRTLKQAPTEAGLNRVAWDLREEAVRPRRERQQRREFFGPRGGVSVVPGTYTARLTLDGEVHETPIVVRVDPLVEATDADLRAAHDLGKTFSTRSERANTAMRILDALLAQLGDRQATTKQLADAEDESAPQRAKLWQKVREQIEEQLHVWTREEGKPFWSQGPQLADRLGGLARQMGSSFSAPTAAQQAYAAELVTESDAAFAEVDRFLAEDLPAINTELAEHGAAPLVAPASLE